MSPVGTPPSLSGAIASEKAVVEMPALDLLQSLGWQHGNLMQEEPGAKNPTGRLSLREVILPARLRAALRRLNPALPDEALQQAEVALTEDRSAMLPVAANREVYRLLRDGVPVELRQADGSSSPSASGCIDWTNPAANDFFLASQVWIASDLYKRRPDAVGFVNGIPLLLIEWKAPHAACPGSLRRQPARLPRHHSAPVRLQRLHHPVERARGAHGTEPCALRGLRRRGSGWRRTGRRAWRWRRCCGPPASPPASST